MNNTCDGFFWMWFVRPFAETLGGIALVAVLVVIVVAIALVMTIANGRKKIP